MTSSGTATDYHTLISERGTRLSGANVKRIAIARAILKKFANPDSR